MRPRYEDFGLTEDAVDGLPRPLIASQWARIVLCTYGVLLATVIAGGAWLSGSPGAALFFGVLLVAAASVLLIPAAIAVVWAAQQFEERWLCRKVHGYRAWTQYREALSEHERLARTLQSQTVDQLRRWFAMDRCELRRELVHLVVARGHRVERVEDGDAAGFDLTVIAGSCRIAVRCHAGSRPCGVAEARELITAALDADATAPLLVAPAGATEQLAGYLRTRSLRIVDGRQLMAAEDRGVIDLFELAVGRPDRT